jgi:phosphatidylserine decarboxylase
MTIYYRERYTGQILEEKIFGEKALRYLYSCSPLGKALRYLISRSPLWSRFYGWWQSQSFTKSNVAPFIKEYDMDPSEFVKKVSEFDSFNDFFIRELKREARPIAESDQIVVMPADARYLAIPNIQDSDGFLVKGQKFTLDSFLQDKALADKYRQGTMVMARLCPTDYHRFHFPCGGTCSTTTWINGWLYSVNPIALRQNIQIFCQNKRCYTSIATSLFGDVLMAEIGATSVGTIIQTYRNAHQHKAAEKGYFSFGASSIILLFEPGKIELEKDLAATAQDKIELRCLMGQPLGKAIS